MFINYFFRGGCVGFSIQFLGIERLFTCLIRICQVFEEMKIGYEVNHFDNSDPIIPPEEMQMARHG